MDGKGRPDLGREFYEAQAYIAHMEAMLTFIGAKKIHGDWYFPHYQYDAPTVMLMPERWVNAQKRAARLLSKFIEANCDSTSSDVLPDLGGQNLTD